MYSYLWIVISNFYIYCFSTEVLFQFAKTFNWHLLSGFQVLSMNFCQHIFFVHFILRYDFFEILFSYLYLQNSFHQKVLTSVFSHSDDLTIAVGNGYIATFFHRFVFYRNILMMYLLVKPMFYINIGNLE